MKAKEKQVKASNRKHEVMSVTAVVQPSKKAKTTTIHKQSEIEIHHWLQFNADKLNDIIKQIQNIQTGLRQVASLVRANYILK
jgi:hypothetical protein